MGEYEKGNEEREETGSSDCCSYSDGQVVGVHGSFFSRLAVERKRGSLKLIVRPCLAYDLYKDIM